MFRITLFFNIYLRFLLVLVNMKVVLWFFLHFLFKNLFFAIKLLFVICQASRFAKMAIPPQFYLRTSEGISVYLKRD